MPLYMRLSLLALRYGIFHKKRLNGDNNNFGESPGHCRVLLRVGHFVIYKHINIPVSDNYFIETHNA